MSDDELWNKDGRSAGMVLMADCPCCGYPGPAPNDDAFWLRYRFLSPEKKAALRKMADAIIDAEKRQKEGKSDER